MLHSTLDPVVPWLIGLDVSFRACLNSPMCCDELDMNLRTYLLDLADDDAVLPSPCQVMTSYELPVRLRPHTELETWVEGLHAEAALLKTGLYPYGIDPGTEVITGVGSGSLSYLHTVDVVVVACACPPT
jgi:hypothetical protein